MHKELLRVPQPRHKAMVASLMDPDIDGGMINEQIDAISTLPLSCFVCLFYNPSRLRFPWDLDAAFGQDNGYGGKPGDKYCVLACEQVMMSGQAT